MYNIIRDNEKCTSHNVWLSKTLIKEVGELLELYYNEYPLSSPLQLSRLCNMGLMMLASLSVDELKNVDNWYRSCKY